MTSLSILSEGSFCFLRLHGVTELINQPVEQMMNSQNEDSKDTNAEGNGLNSFDVLGRKIYLISFHSKIKAQKIPTDCYPARRILFTYLFRLFFLRSPSPGLPVA